MNISDKRIVEKGKETIQTEIKALELLVTSLDETFIEIIKSISECQGKVIVTGMGKSGHIGKKIAATLSSLGKASFFLHPGEAFHGDLGMISKKDIVLGISYSGESEEVIRIIPNIKAMEITLIGISGNKESTLVKYSDYCFVLPEFREACSLNLAPTSSTTAVLALGDAIAVCVSDVLGFSEENYALFHPGGSLGKKLLLKASDLMHSKEKNAVVFESASLKDAILEMSMKSLGIVNVISSSGTLLGVYTDGDLRKSMAKGVNIYEEKIVEIMKKKPRIINTETLAIEALKIMNEHNISALPIIEDQLLIGTVRINDIVKAGIVI